MGTDEMHDRVVRVLVEEGLKDAERDVEFYIERIASNLRDGLSAETWTGLLDEARGIRRFCRSVLDAAERAIPDPIDMAKAAAEVADMAPGEAMEVYGK